MVRSESVLRIAKVLAGLPRTHRELVVDFMRREFGLAEKRESRTQVELAAKKLAREFKVEIEREAYHFGRKLDFEQFAEAALQEAERAELGGQAVGHALVSKMREEAQMLEIISAKNKKEAADRHYEQLEDARDFNARLEAQRKLEQQAEWRRMRVAEASAERRRRREAHDDWRENLAVAAYRRWFERHLKEIKKLYEGDGGYGIQFSALLFMGNLEGARAYFKRIPQGVRDENPMLHTMLIAAEMFFTKKDVEHEPVYMVPTPLDMMRPTPFNS